METVKTVDFEQSGLSKGMKVAALTLMLTAAALMTDHVAFAPSARPVAAPSTVEAVTTTAALDGFALPAELQHPTTADVDTPPPGF